MFIGNIQCKNCSSFKVRSIVPKTFFALASLFISLLGLCLFFVSLLIWFILPAALTVMFIGLIMIHIENKTGKKWWLCTNCGIKFISVNKSVL